MADGQRDDRRLRGAGTELERFLADSGSVRSTVRLLRRPQILPQLLYQSFVIMARRTATSRPGFDPRAFTEAVLAADGSSAAERIEVGVRMIRDCASREVHHERIPGKHQDVLVLLLLGMIREEALDAAGIAALSRTAESRQRRLWRKQTRRSWRQRSKNGGAEDGHPEDGRARSGPGTVAGWAMRAWAEFDNAAVDELPADPDGRATDAVLDAVFREALAVRFPGGTPDPEQQADLAGRVAASMTDGRVRESAVAALLADPGVPPDGVSAEELTVLRILVFQEVVEELGLFGREVDEMIGRAEERVRADGLTPMRWPTS